MSHFSEIPVSYRDTDCVVQALIAIGYKKDQIEVHKIPAPVRDYRNQQTTYRWQDQKDERFKAGDVAHVIVRKEHVGQTCNDFAVYVDPAGDSKIFACDYSRNGNRCYQPKIKALGGHSAKFFHKLADEYGYAVAKKHYTARGKQVVRVDEGEKIKCYVKA